MRVLITGATGLIGQEIVQICHKKNISVNYLTTSKSKIKINEDYKGFFWDPTNNQIDVKCFKDVVAIIHLAGATVSNRWTASYKKEIIASRTQTTALLIQALKGITHTVKHVISASAIGVYPDSVTNYYDQEHNEINGSFLGQVVSVWEQAVDQFETLNIAVSKIRIGLVLSDKGGALKEIIKPIKLGLGSAFGTGEQWQSWIHIRDLGNMFVFVLQNKIEGVFNGVAPNPVSNNELTKTAATVLKKPLFMPNIPKFAMKLVLGEMHIILFESQRVSSKRIVDKGFYFEFNCLYLALENLL